MNYETHATQRDLANHYANWMNGRSWDHCATLTFDRHISPRTAAVYVENTFIRDLERTWQRRIDYYGSIELGAANERPHAHVLLSGTSSIDSADIAARWLRGRSTVEAFDTERAGVWYAGKDLGQEQTLLLLRDLRNG